MTDNTPQPPVGIDLGTTFSAVAFLDSDGRPETIRNSEGDLTTPSAVFFDHNRPIVGIEASEAGLLEPDRLALFAKRDVGESFYEKAIRGKHLPAEVIQALVLRKLKSDAELKLGKIRDAVITVPAFFNEPCRKATQDAGRLAGLNVLDIINEPTAAAITYGVEQGFLSAEGVAKQSEMVLVYDLGGGTFDVTVMKIESGHFHTIATAGDVYLGGVDWDARIVDFIAQAFEKEHGVDPRQDPTGNQELLRKANQTKHALTQRESVTVAFAHNGKRLRTELTQSAFAESCADLVERTLMTVGMVLDDANIGWSDLTRLILVGGSTRMPMIRTELERLSGMPLDRSLSPDEAVCHGAALYAGMLMAGHEDKSGISVSNVNSHDLGILAIDPKTGNPRRQVMIPRNSPLPAQKTVRFRTHTANQANVKIEIVEGGDNRGINATKIGKCIVDDLPPRTPKGTDVDVQFDYTADGRLTIHASLPEIDRKITMTLDRAAGLTDEALLVWKERLDAGLSDAMLSELPDAVAVEPPLSFPDEAQDRGTPVINELPGELQPTDAAPKIQIAPKINAASHSGAAPKIDTAPKIHSRPPVNASPDLKPTSKGNFDPIDIAAFKSDAGPKPAKVSSLAEIPPQRDGSRPDRSHTPGTAVPAEPTVPNNPPNDATSVPDFAPIGNGPSRPVEVDRSRQARSESAHPKKLASEHPKQSVQPAKKPSTSATGDLPEFLKPNKKISAADGMVLPPGLAGSQSPVSEKPKIQLDQQDHAPAAKADSDDLARLAALGGSPKPSVEKPAVPLIKTDAPSASKDSEPGKTAKPKKSGGLFGRRKK